MSAGRPFVTALLVLGLTASCSSGGSDSPGVGGAVSSTGGASSTGGVTATGGTTLINNTGGTPPVQCKGTGEACTNSLDCCEGSTCNNTAQAPALNGCHPRCTQNTDCQTGCCVLFSGDTQGICAEKEWCGCGIAGSQCGGSHPACCNDHVCLGLAAPATGFACSKKCQTKTDCTTNCCVPVPSLGISACLEPSYCPAP
jgi:hypothetical protein